jgi:hypothetical protein
MSGALGSLCECMDTHNPRADAPAHNQTHAHARTNAHTAVREHTHTTTHTDARTLSTQFPYSRARIQPCCALDRTSHSYQRSQVQP